MVLYVKINVGIPTKNLLEFTVLATAIKHEVKMATTKHRTMVYGPEG